MEIGTDVSGMESDGVNEKHPGSQVPGVSSGKILEFSLTKVKF